MWCDTDLVDIPKAKALPAVESTSLRFTTPSSAPPVMATTLPTTEMVDSPRLRKTKAPAIPNLSILKSTQSTDTVTQKHSWTLPDSESSITGDCTSEPTTPKKEVRVRCYNFNNQALSLARTKALSAKKGNTDWGVSSFQLSVIKHVSGLNAEASSHVIHNCPLITGESNRESQMTTRRQTHIECIFQ